MFQKIYHAFLRRSGAILVLGVLILAPPPALSTDIDSAATPERLVEKIERVFPLERHALELGNAKGDITIIEFVDYNCGFCKRLHSYLPELIARDGSIRWFHLEYPILGPLSRRAARAALASRFQGKHASYADALLRAPRLSEQRLFTIAEDLGMDVERLQRDMGSPEVEESLTHSLALGQALEISHTPTLIIDDVYIPGMIPRAELENLIADLRRGTIDRKAARE